MLATLKIENLKCGIVLSFIPSTVRPSLSSLSNVGDAIVGLVFDYFCFSRRCGDNRGNVTTFRLFSMTFKISYVFTVVIFVVMHFITISCNILQSFETNRSDQ